MFNHSAVESLLVKANELAASRGVTLDQVLTAYKIVELKRKNDIFDSASDESKDTGDSIARSMFKLAESLEILANK